MRHVVIVYPEGLTRALDIPDNELGPEVAFLAAAKLYELGRLSAAWAARLAGLGQVEFLARLAGVIAGPGTRAVEPTGAKASSTEVGTTVVWADRAAFLTAFDAALTEAGIEIGGPTMAPEELQRYLAAAGIRPEDNLLTAGIVAAREE